MANDKEKGRDKGRRSMIASGKGIVVESADGQGTDTCIIHIPQGVMKQFDWRREVIIITFVRVLNLQMKLR